MQNTANLSNDGERMIPYHHKGMLIYAEHITRYQAAMDFVQGKVVLDIASGSGYGTKLISKKANKVYGVDISEDAIRYATDNYSAPNISYIVGDGESIPLDDNSVDVITTFETIEHVRDYKKFLGEVSRVLKDDGTLIISTPNDLEFAEGNHFHLHEFKESELTVLLSKKFRYIQKYYQATWKSVGIGKKEFFKIEGEHDATIENLSPISSKKYLYFYFICSNKVIKKGVKNHIAIGEHYSDRKMLEEKNVSEGTFNSLINEKNKTLSELNNNINKLKEAMDIINGSRTYKIATKLARISRFLKLDKLI